jgi:hypothetical protein
MNWSNRLLLVLVVALNCYLVVDRFLFALVADLPRQDGLAVRTVQRKALRPNSAVRVRLGLFLELIPRPVFGGVIDIGYDCADESAAHRRTEVDGKGLRPYDTEAPRYALDLFNCHGVPTCVEKSGQLLHFAKAHRSDTLSRRTYAESDARHLSHPLANAIWPIYGPATRVLVTRPTLGQTNLPGQSHGAGDGNRTRMTSLEGWGSAIELRPHDLPAQPPAVVLP